ncbi:MAG TPA: hypothetical protein PLD20_34190 [Blastocatellia bacterium]|nr:hypothetical protein [Blastocatellia bacterium]HMV87976.1 hypothetical protein [Blastocatellia bacterium]HMX28665.1 hypothetical protein [Blastocatellia bacterium]HMZ23025.1 hypothetical protein [Blastocatellia bacterium]HNG34760.1 hypothetical protein [Blastocatellia bacterium]
MPTIQNPSTPEPQASVSLSTLYVQLIRTLGQIIEHPDCLPVVRVWLTKLVTIFIQAQTGYWMLPSHRTLGRDVRSH